MKNLIGSKEIYLVVGFNKAYLGKAETYLATMNKNSKVNNVIVTLDFDIDSSYKKKFSSLRFVKILSSQIKSPNPNTCMQHGGFLEVLGFVKDDSIIIFTDTDIKVQRPFNKSELEMLNSCEDRDVFVNLNMSEEQTLLDDTQIVPANIATNELIKKYAEFSTFKSYNTGVIIANYKTYKQLYQKYNQYWPDFTLLFDSFVKQQILLSYIIQKYFHLRTLPYTIHSQAASLPIKKYSSKKRIGYIGEEGIAGFKLCIGSEIVVFNHHVKHENELEIKILRKRIRGLYKIVSFLAFLLLATVLVILLNRLC